jgi:hypothetical protein
VFERAKMWTRENRRVFAVVEHLREQAGVPLGDAPDLGYYLVRDIGLFRLLNNAIDGYSMDRLGGWNRRANRRIISALTPHGGARGAVMLTVTLGEMLAHKGLDPCLPGTSLTIGATGFEPATLLAPADCANRVKGSGTLSGLRACAHNPKQ